MNQVYKVEKLFIALNKLAQNQFLHPRCNTLFYILFLTFDITCNTIYNIWTYYVHTGQHSEMIILIRQHNTLHKTLYHGLKLDLISVIISYHKQICISRIWIRCYLFCICCILFLAYFFRWARQLWICCENAIFQALISDQLIRLAKVKLWNLYWNCHSATDKSIYI